MKLRGMIRGIFAVLTAMASVASSAQQFVDTSRSAEFLEVSVRGIVGASTVLQNYKHCFPEIKNNDVNLGLSVGAGAKVVFGLRNFFGIGTELAVLANNYSMDFAVINTEFRSMSAVYTANRYWCLNVPVFVSFRFNVAPTVRWDVDAGMYYSFGFAGFQKQDIYHVQINDLGQLAPDMATINTDYFHSDSTFQTYFTRGDIGLHLETGLCFSQHFVVGMRMQVGVKNLSKQVGLVAPNVRNFVFQGILGYKF